MVAALYVATNGVYFGLPDVDPWDAARDARLYAGNEGGARSSDLIRLATGVVHDEWGWPPRDGLITAVRASVTAAKRSSFAKPGRCFRAAGWREFERRDDGDQVWLRAPETVRVAP